MDKELKGQTNRSDDEAAPFRMFGENSQVALTLNLQMGSVKALSRVVAQLQ